MSLMPYWLRHLRYLGYPTYRDPLTRILEDHYSALARDPIIRDPLKFIKQVTAPFEKDFHVGIEGVYSDSEVKIDGKKVEVHLDVQNFKPDQIEVKTVGKEIMIEAKSEVKKDDGWIKSHFERRFLLPEGFPPEKVECHLDKGKLKLIAFRSEPLDERKIPIQDKSASRISSSSSENTAPERAKQEM